MFIFVLFFNFKITFFQGEHCLLGIFLDFEIAVLFKNFEIYSSYIYFLGFSSLIYINLCTLQNNWILILKSSKRVKFLKIKV